MIRLFEKKTMVRERDESNGVASYLKWNKSHFLPRNTVGWRGLNLPSCKKLHMQRLHFFIWERTLGKCFALLRHCLQQINNRYTKRRWLINRQMTAAGVGSTSRHPWHALVFRHDEKCQKTNRKFLPTLTVETPRSEWASRWQWLHWWSFMEPFLVVGFLATRAFRRSVPAWIWICLHFS